MGYGELSEENPALKCIASYEEVHKKDYQRFKGDIEWSEKRTCT